MVKKTEGSSKIPSSSPNPNSVAMMMRKYKGVRMRSWGSWVSEIRAPNQKTRIWLGSYSTPEAAARAYDAALYCLKGLSARLNFPGQLDRVPLLQQNPSSQIMSPKSIQRIAAAAATAAADCDDSGSDNLIVTTKDLGTQSCCSSPVSDDSSSSSPSLSLWSSSSSSSSSNGEGDGVLAKSLASWYSFDSPKYNDMVNGVMFDSSYYNLVEDCWCEDNDIRLWSFC